MARPLSFALRGVTVERGGVRALDGVDLEIAPGETVALVGPSGSGKTTLLGLLNGLVEPTSGTVLVDGRELAGSRSAALRELRARIGYLPQDLGLVPNLRVLSNVLAGRIGRRGLFASLRALVAPARAEAERVLELLDRLGIGEKLYQRADALSGGERQRVAIARALYQEADALLADEPLSALDPARAEETLALLFRVATEEAWTLVLSMHDVALARAHATRLVGLREGRVLFDAPAGDVGEEELERLYALHSEGRP